MNKRADKFLLAVLIFVLTSIGVKAQETSDEVIGLKTFLSHDKVVAGGEMKLAVQLEIKKPWHINSHNPKDEFLIPTDLGIDSKDKFTLASVSYPQAHDYKFDFSEQPVSVFEGKVFLYGVIKAPVGISTGSYPVTVKLEYQACNNQTCKAPKTISIIVNLLVASADEKRIQVNPVIFGKIKEEEGKDTVKKGNVDSLSTQDIIKFTPFLSFDKVFPNSQVKVALVIKIAKGKYIYSNAAGTGYIPSRMTIAGIEDILLLNPYFPNSVEIKPKFAKQSFPAFKDEITTGAVIQLPKNIKPGMYKAKIEFLYEAFDDKGNKTPETAIAEINLEVIATKEAQKAINKEIFSKLPVEYSPVEKGEKTVKEVEDSGISSLIDFNKSGIFLSLIVVFLGGLALNLTPCVYPLIPITIGYFGGQSEGKTSRLAAMGLLYVLGIALTYSIIGVVTALSGGIFGALLQKWYVLVAVAGILIALALSMFGVYEFKLPDKLVMSAGGAKSGMYGAFFMGLTMGIVAAPCIGPFVLGLVTYVALQKDVLKGFLLFFFLSLGLGLPYFILAIFSGKIKKLPRAGMWMESVKHIFGYILLGMALYFVLPAISGISDSLKTVTPYLFPIYMLISTTLLIFFDKSALGNKGFAYFKAILGSITIVIAVFSLYSLTFSKTNQESVVSWKKYTQIEYDESFKKKKIVIDFYADWCIPCKELDAVTFVDPKVGDAIKEFSAFKADLTKSGSDLVEELTKKFEIKGVPTVLILDSKGKEVARITGFVPPAEFLLKLEKAK